MNTSPFNSLVQCLTQNPTASKPKPTSKAPHPTASQTPSTCKAPTPLRTTLVRSGRVQATTLPKRPRQRRQRTAKAFPGLFTAQDILATLAQL